MLSLSLKNLFGIQAARRLGIYSINRFLATKSDSDDSDAFKKSGDMNVIEAEKKVYEKHSPKKEEELPDFPEFPSIRTDFEAGIRSRDYLKTVPREKNVDLLKKEPGSIVYFDDEEFKYYFPHDFYTGFEKQKELTLMNTMQVRPEAIDIMKKLDAFQKGEPLSIYPFLCLTGPRGSGKSMVLRSLYYHCRRNNWITMYVPSAHIWTHRGYQVIEMTRREGGFFAQPEHCQKLLFDLHVTSGHLMKNVPLKGKYDRSLFWAKSQFGAAIDSGAIKSMNLDQLVLYGVNSARDAYEVAAYVKHELDICTEYPVLIAIDDYNALYDYSAFEYRNRPIHARKLYLASLFRMFDESDYTPAMDPVLEATRPRSTGVKPVIEDKGIDGTKCKFKNTLRNGVVIGAIENRYDHFIPFKDVVKLGQIHNQTVNNISYDEFNKFVNMFSSNEIIIEMTEAQKQYMYSYTQGNFREVIWALLMNRRWLCDYLPKKDFFDWVDTKGGNDLQKLWAYE